MNGWTSILLLSAVIFVALWRFARLERATLQLLASALLLALAGYAWQGNPELAGSPRGAQAREPQANHEFAESRKPLLGQFTTTDRWLTIAESYQRRGDSRNGAGVIRAGLRAHPDDAGLWAGLGFALVIHADGLMTPAAQLAFQRSATIAPRHPGPPFFFGLALARGGRLEEAEAVWRSLLASDVPGSAWRPLVEDKLLLVEQARRMSAAAQ